MSVFHMALVIAGWAEKVHLHLTEKHAPMKVDVNKVRELTIAIEAILARIEDDEKKHKHLIDRASPEYRKSAKNLIHYHSLRSHDLRNIQKQLRYLGLSRLANSGGHVRASLLHVRFFLRSLIKVNTQVPVKSGLSIKSGRKLLANHTREVLGYRAKNRRVRIMVTLPREAAFNRRMVNDMVKSGMNCARINCAHDDPDIWLKIINNIHKASKSLGRQVKVTMDLAGPKNRTGYIIPGPKVKKFSPVRDAMGRVIEPAMIKLVPNRKDKGYLPEELPVSKEWLQKLSVGEVLRIEDTRGKQRKLKVIKAKADYCLVQSVDTCYFSPGVLLTPERSGLSPIQVGDLESMENALLLRVGDGLIVHRAQEPGSPAMFDEQGSLIKKAHISCQMPEVFDVIRPGQKVLFDDGKIEGLVTSSNKEAFEMQITKAREGGSRLKAEKGINLPDTQLKFSGLTDKDKEDLAFVAAHADAVNYSFVNSSRDVEELMTLLEQVKGGKNLNVILKIETRQAYDNLTDILLTAMQKHYIGVMIARGDLAVETGWDNIGRVQREILSICNAAHVPVIWATQVLEGLAKKGLPSRSEITDATTSLKAECVMLNKGPFILQAIGLLDTILHDMEKLHEKNETMLPRLESFQD